MSTLRLAPDDTVTFCEVSVTEEQSGQFVLGNVQTGDFVSLPLPGIFVVREFQRGQTTAQVNESFKARFDETPDLAEFIEGLAGVGLVQRVGDTVIAAPPQ